MGDVFDLRDENVPRTCQARPEVLRLALLARQAENFGGDNPTEVAVALA